MDTASKTKVQPGTIVTRVEEIDTTFELRVSKPVDEQLLSLFETIQTPGVGSPESHRNDCLEKAAHALNKAHGCVALQNRAALDEIAQDLSHNALKMGAGKLLSSAIEFQGLARIGDFKTAAELLGRMEVELIEVRAHYS